MERRTARTNLARWPLQAGLIMTPSAITVDLATAPTQETGVRKWDAAIGGASRPASIPSARPALEFSKLSVLMAVYNEEATLPACVNSVLAVPLPRGLEREIVLVDDNSTDASWEIAERLAAQHPQIRLFRQPKNSGKGAAIRRAIQEMSGDIALIQDADLEYSPPNTLGCCGPSSTEEPTSCLGRGSSGKSGRCFISGIRWATGF